MSCPRKNADQKVEPVPKPKCFEEPLYVKEKRLLGAGPSNASEEILKAVSRPVMGHLHPETLKIMDDIKEGLKYVFQTHNPLTLCVSASGHGGMECAMCNLIEDGDVVLCAVNGLWGRRAGDIAERYGADVRYIEGNSSTAAEAITLDRLLEYFKVHKPKVFFCAQGDSSTGFLQTQLEEIGDLCRKFDCLFVVDTVASLGGTPFLMDRWKVDVAYSCSQKVFGAPPGLAPISFGPRAIQKVKDRNSLIKVYYWDILLLADYWNCFGKPRIYHHTISTTLLYGLRQALAAVCKEGLNEVIARHQATATNFHKKLEDLGMDLYIRNPENRLPTITSISLPRNCDPKAVSDYANETYALEIAGGLGPTAGKIVRVGLMGTNAQKTYADKAIRAIKEALEKAGFFSKL